jgi:plasmid maintenance system antidote protein VapI
VARKAAAASAHLITRAELARRLGVSRASVTKACRKGGRLAPAVSGKAVNALHPAARSWLAERTRKSSARKTGARRAAAKNESSTRRPAPELDAAPESIAVDAPDPPDDDDDDEPEAPTAPVEFGAWLDADLAELAEPLTQLTERYGSAPAFTAWVKARKQLEEARKAEMLRERVAGRLIARTTVDRMIDHLDVAFRLLLTDAPRAIAIRLGCSNAADAARMIRDMMGQHLSAAQTQMAAALEADDPMAPLTEAAA